MGDDDAPLVIQHYFMMVCAICSGLACIPFWVTPNVQDYFWFLLIDVVGFTAQLFFTVSLQQPGNQVSFLSGIMYSEVIYGLIIGYLLFQESYSLQSLVGIFLIFTVLALSFVFKPKHKKEEFVEE